MDDNEALAQLIDENYNQLIDTQSLAIHPILYALADIETGFGSRRLASRHEKGYCYGSVLYNGPNGGDLREQTWKYGCLAHSSFGSWQIMFIAAFELGFRGDPIELREDAVCLPYVIRFINRRILGKYPRIQARGVADAYNSGNPNDQNIPKEYMDKFEVAYNKRWAQLNPPEVLRT